MILPSRNPLSGLSLLIASVWYAKYLFSDFTFFACTFRTAISIVRSVRFTNRIFQKSEDLSLREFISNMGLKWKWRPLTTIPSDFTSRSTLLLERTCLQATEKIKDKLAPRLSQVRMKRDPGNKVDHTSPHELHYEISSLSYFTHEAWNNCMNHQNVVTFLTLFSDDMTKANII